MQGGYGMPKIFGQLICLFVLVLTVTPCVAHERSGSNVIIFVSFSMPKESIKGWMNEAEKIHAPVVIRGLVNNSFKETIKRVNELVGDNKGGLQLDPVLFKEFKVNQVPAVVVRNQYDHDIVYGDVHLDYALQTIIKKNDGLSPLAKNALDKLRGRTA